MTATEPPPESAHRAPRPLDVDPLDPSERRVRAEARVGTTVVATMTGRFPVRSLFVADDFELAPDASPTEVFAAFARAAASAVGSPLGEVLVTEPTAPPGWRIALEAEGLVVLRRKVCVRRALDGSEPEVCAQFVLRSLADAGEVQFRQRLSTASEGDPFDVRAGAERDLEREWRDLVGSAGARFDPATWFLVDDDEGPVGVVLPQVVNAEVGTLYYVGVEPARRGKGLGAALHALGLRLLAQRGLRRYVGSTDERNAPMLRTFARNGCVVSERDLFLGGPP